jgi:hypothetical protein
MINALFGHICTSTNLKIITCCVFVIILLNEICAIASNRVCKRVYPGQANPPHILAARLALARLLTVASAYLCL